ncbi:MAG: DUF3226 domain-containing protein [Bacteroidales bacterium]
MNHTKCNVIIVFEGIADKKFLEDLICSKYGLTKNELKRYWVNIRGFQHVANTEFVKNNYLPAIEDDKKIIFILDADQTGIEDGGKVARTNKIIADLKKQKIDIDPEDIYLFPNNKNDGDLETLLESIFVKENLFFTECWNKFEGCITQAGEDNNQKLTIPPQKSKIYTYCQILLPSDRDNQEKAKDAKRNYLDKELWDLQKQTLKPLYNFLDKYFKE